MAKIFKIDKFTITLEESLFNKAVEYFVLEPDNDEEEKKGNYISLKHLIKICFTPNLETLNKISHEEIRQKYTDEEISKAVSEKLISEIKINGGDY